MGIIAKNPELQEDKKEVWDNYFIVRARGKLFTGLSIVCWALCMAPSRKACEHGKLTRYVRNDCDYFLARPP